MAHICRIKGNKDINVVIPLRGATHSGGICYQPSKTQSLGVCVAVRTQTTDYHANGWFLRGSSLLLC